LETLTDIKKNMLCFGIHHNVMLCFVTQAVTGVAGSIVK
jgi:hypothetical protein